LALVGTGFIGSVHAKNAACHPGAELVAVYDANLESCKRIGGATGAKTVATISSNSRSSKARIGVRASMNEI